MIGLLTQLADLWIIPEFNWYSSQCGVTGDDATSAAGRAAQNPKLRSFDTAKETIKRIKKPPDVRRTLATSEQIHSKWFT